MTVEMGILNRVNGEYAVAPVATSETFRRVWLPACERLGLKWVGHFHDGALNTVPFEVIPQVVAELARLREWARGEPSLGYLVERINSLLRAIQESDPVVCELTSDSALEATHNHNHSLGEEGGERS